MEHNTCIEGLPSFKCLLPGTRTKKMTNRNWNKLGKILRKIKYEIFYSCDRPAHKKDTTEWLSTHRDGWQLSGFESRHLSKIQNECHKQRSGQHPLVSQKNKQTKFIIRSIYYVQLRRHGTRRKPHGPDKSFLGKTPDSWIRKVSVVWIRTGSAGNG